jgi:hypothetical protein
VRRPRLLHWVVRPGRRLERRRCPRLPSTCNRRVDRPWSPLWPASLFSSGRALSCGHRRGYSTDARHDSDSSGTRRGWRRDRPQWRTLAIGAGFGGNLTPIGSAAGVLMLSLGRRWDAPITVRCWFESGLPATLVSCAVGKSVPTGHAHIRTHPRASLERPCSAVAAAFYGHYATEQAGRVRYHVSSRRRDSARRYP